MWNRSWNVVVCRTTQYCLFVAVAKAIIIFVCVLFGFLSLSFVRASGNDFSDPPYTSPLSWVFDVLQNWTEDLEISHHGTWESWMDHPSVSISSWEFTGPQATTWVTNELSVFPLQYGDIQIVEVFPSSGNCLDEFIRIHFYKEYSGHLSLFGLGISTSEVTVWADRQAWSDLIITDNLAWMIPNDVILLVPSITLTNWGELLKIIVSWEVIDEVFYSRLQWTQSLFFSQMSGAQRLFQTNGPWTPPTSCAKISPSQITWWVGLCDIVLKSSNYLWTGVYSLEFQSVWQYVSWCLNEDSFSGERTINWVRQLLGQCQTKFETQLWINIVEFRLHWPSGCYDQFIFANNYDIGIVKEYVSSPLWWSCNSGAQKSSASFMTHYDCGIQYQWSTALGFFANSTFNFITTYGGNTLTNTNKQYKCRIYMGDGNVLNECNPSSYKYSKAGVYTVTVDVFDVSLGQPVCKSRSFINIPLKNLMSVDRYAYRYWLDQQVSSYCSLQDWDRDDELSNTQAFCKMVQATGYVDLSLRDSTQNSPEASGSVCTTWILYVKIHSVLPNPIWSDSKLEEISFIYWDIAQLSDMSDRYDLSDYTVHIGSKKLKLSGDIWLSEIKTMVWGRWLNNNGMCISLHYDRCGIVDEKCYNSVKEGQVVLFEASWLILSWELLVWDTDALGRDSMKSNTIKLPIRIGWPKLTKLYLQQDDSQKELTCTEKIANAKAKDREKYNKLKIARQKDATMLKSQRERYKIKEQIARNNRYLYENTNKLIVKMLQKEWPAVLEQSNIEWVVSVAQHLETSISSWMIYTEKDTKKGRYRYTNSISSYINQEKHVSVIDVGFPWLSDYLTLLEGYEINKSIIEKL